MVKKDIMIGIIVGLIANAIGLVLASILLGNGEDPITAIQTAQRDGFLGKLVSLGAILNLVVFFVFLNKKMDNRARGVLLATILVAIFTFVIKL